MKVLHYYRSSSHRHYQGFTLIEMLIVIVIIGILIALATPALNGVMQANKLTSAGQNMLGRLSQAQQMAATLNKTVEVRFYKYTDLEVNYLGPQFFSYQFLVLDTKTKSDNSFTEVLRPLGAPMEIGNSTLICSTKIKEADASPLLAKENLIDDGTGSAESPKFFLKAKAQYVALRFSPDGKVRRLTKQMADSMSVSEELLLPDAYLTVVPSNKADGGNAVPNYYSIQVDPYGGHARFYQPVP